MSHASPKETVPTQHPPVLGGVAPYLMVSDARKAAEFYKQAFAASEVGAAPPDEKGRTMHIHLVINGGSVMLCDPFPEHGHPHVPMQGFNLHLQVDDAEVWWKRATAAGAAPRMPLTDMFWGDRYGQLDDPFGVTWALATPTAKYLAAAGDVTFTISRGLAAPRDAVWQAFTDERRMQRWWGPKGFEVFASKMSLEPGGAYHYGLRSPNGQEIWGKFVYRDIVAPERVVLVNSFSDAQGGVTRHPMAAGWPLRMLTTFRFEPEGDTRTRLTVSSLPLDASEEEKRTFGASHASLTQGWSGTLDQLEAYLASAQAG